MTAAADQLLETLRAKYRDEMNELTNYVAGGGCIDFAEYKHITGKIEGYAFAERELLDLDQRINLD